MDRQLSTAEGLDQGSLQCERTDLAPFEPAQARRAGRLREAPPEVEPLIPLQLLLVAVRHFLPNFNHYLRQMDDPRDPRRVHYSITHLIWEEILMFLGGVRSRNGMVSETLSHGFLTSLQVLAETDEAAAAHPDSAYYLLRHLDSDELIRFQAKLLHDLFRMRCFDSFRFQGEWLVAIDGVWLRRYDYPHCPHCLRQTLSNGETIYHHAILEAKLILGNGMVISLASVPIENANSHADKQDCELTALPRLLTLLRELYPRLPICLLGDSLYACKPVIALCEQHRFSYILVHKAGRTPTFYQQARAAAARGPRHHVQLENGRHQSYQWANNLDYHGNLVHALFCEETKPTGDTSTWGWISDLRPDAAQAAIIANQGGRQRWKIENEGFNVQKNGTIEFKHDYGSKDRVWYHDYLIVQIAHLLLQLMIFTTLTNILSKGCYRTFAHAYRTVRNFVVRLRESIQRDAADAINLILPTRVPFDTS